MAIDELESLTVTKDTERQVADKNVAAGCYRQFAGINPFAWLITFAVYGLLLSFVVVNDQHFPAPVMSNSSDDGQFVEERADAHLRNMMSFGARPFSSLANQVSAVTYLLDAVEAVRTAMNGTRHRQLDVDVQEINQFFYNTYFDNINNIVVRLRSSIATTNQSLMISCHFDTVHYTTGASDDTMSCCMMLELLHVLALHQHPHKHHIVFVFNGAEETGLQASRGFITKHPWAGNIGAFLNMDAGGAGGHQLLFQSDHPWLVEMYAKHAKHPYGNIFGQEVFQHNLIPSDTDYGNYREFAPGLDFAFIRNGYVYHTPLDDKNMIPPGCMQQAGDNMVALISHIANSSFLSNPQQFERGELVYFDVFGMFMVVYRKDVVGLALNIITVIVAYVWIISRAVVRVAVGPGNRCRRVVKHSVRFIVATLVIIFSWISVAGITVATAFILDQSGHAMSWYSNTWLAIGLYMVPACGVMLLICLIAKRLFYSSPDVNMWDVEALYFDATLLIFSTLLATMTYYNLGSAVLFLIIIVFPAAFRLLRLGLQIYHQRAQTESNSNYHLFWNQYSLYAINLLGQLIPNLLVINWMHIFLYVLIPIQGRAGNYSKPDLFIGSFSAALAVLLMTWQIGIAFVTRCLKWVVAGLMAVFLLVLLLAIFSPIGFPYKAGSSSQRIELVHQDYTVHSEHRDNNVSTIFRRTFDRNGLQDESLDDVSPKSRRNYDSSNVSRLDFQVDTDVRVINQTQLSSNTVQITLSIQAPNLMAIYWKPLPNVIVLGWSFQRGSMSPAVNFTEMWSPSTSSFQYKDGRRSRDPLLVNIELRRMDSICPAPDSFLQIEVSRRYVERPDGKPYLSVDLEQYIASLPAWTTVTAWLETIDVLIV